MNTAGKTVSVILSVLFALVLISALIFCSFGASLDRDAQERITSDAAVWGGENGGFIFSTVMDLVNSAFENRLIYICAGILVLLAAGVIALRRSKCCLYIGIPALLGGGITAIIGTALKLLYVFLEEAAPEVDWAWYGVYLSAFRIRLMVFGVITLAAGIALTVLSRYLKTKKHAV